MLESFLKLETIPGESTDAEYQGQITLLSWSWSVQFDPSEKVGIDQQPKLAIEAFRFVKQLDPWSPKIMFACVSRQVIPQAVLTSRRAASDSPGRILRITLADVRVSSYCASQTAEADAPVEEFVLSFRSIEFECFESRMGLPAGVIRSGWDTVADQPC